MLFSCHLDRRVAQGRLRLYGAQSAVELQLAAEYLKPLLARCRAGLGS